MIKNFTDLITWQESHKLVLAVYKAVIKFPVEEKFALGSQLRRAAISITSNIAEGFARNTQKDKLQFYAISKGSLLELQNQLILAKDLKYINQTEYLDFESRIVTCSKLISGLCKTATDRNTP